MSQLPTPLGGLAVATTTGGLWKVEATHAHMQVHAHTQRVVSIWWSVVSTVASGILFACFPTVECISTICSFLLTSLTVEARNRRERKPLIILGKGSEENNSPTHRK